MGIEWQLRLDRRLGELETLMEVRFFLARQRVMGARLPALDNWHLPML